MKNESFDLLNEWFAYDVTSPSCISWKSRPHRSPVQIGDHCVTWTGRYYRVRLNYHYYQCSRIVLILNGFNPLPGQVADHIDRNTKNNHIKNLRWVTHGQNIKNTLARGKSGVKFAILRPNGTYEARYRSGAGKRMVNCGIYRDAQAAHIAAIAHRLEHYWNP